jgi:hypothetical protein
MRAFLSRHASPAVPGLAGIRLGRIGRIGLLGLLGMAGMALGGCADQAVRPASFRARPDSIVRGDLRGPFVGRVLDGDTDRPVSGALVHASWRYIAGTGLTAPAGYREWIGSTDPLGRYLVPRLDQVPGRSPGGGARLADFHLVIYKRGYVAYRSDRRFDDLGPQTEFSQQGATIALLRWRPELSHAKHLRFVGGGPALAALTTWELPDAVAELSGAKPAALAERRRADAAPATKLDASRLLGAADIKQLTGYEGAFDSGELGDEPQSATYDTVHLQARGKDESFDVALRMWKAAPDEATKQFERLAGELPGAQVKNELADRSLRAAAPGGEILGLAFLDSRRGIVVLIQCGASQCRTHETVLSLARLVKNRVETMFPTEGAGK